MFFIFGWTLKVIGTKELRVPCPACKENSLLLVGVQNFFHLFWIPIIPLSKSNQVACGSCGADYPSKSLSLNLSDEDQKFKTPWWGLWFVYGALPLFVIFIIISLATVGDS